MKRNLQSIILCMKTSRKKIYVPVIRNKGSEDCYTATCNHALLHTQCMDCQCYNKQILKRICCVGVGWREDG